MSNQLLLLGRATPNIVARTPDVEKFHLETIAGRYVVLCFFGSAGSPGGRRVLDDIEAHRDRFNDYDVTFFGVSIDPEDESSGRVKEMLPGIHQFWDFDQKASRLYGAIPEGVDEASALEAYQPLTVILDERLRVFGILQFNDPAQHVARILEGLSMLPDLGQPRRGETPAPILVVPRVFEPNFCRKLIDYYEQNGGRESGFMREEGGKTVLAHDTGHKRRRDQPIVDDDLQKACLARLRDRLLPEIHKAFQFEATRIERYLVACYDAASGGHFGAHHDNTTRGTAHRRFAVSMNLNTGQYKGGMIGFPEFGRQLYEAPAGGAVVFSCSLLHRATKVTEGRRFAFLPFLFDEAAARIREENMKFLDEQQMRQATAAANQ